MAVARVSAGLTEPENADTLPDTCDRARSPGRGGNEQDPIAPGIPQAGLRSVPSGWDAERHPVHLPMLQSEAGALQE